MLAFLAKRAQCSTVCLPRSRTMECGSWTRWLGSWLRLLSVQMGHASAADCCSSSSLLSCQPSLLSYSGLTLIMNSHSCSKSRLCICKLFRTKFPSRVVLSERVDIRFVLAPAPNERLKILNEKTFYRGKYLIQSLNPVFNNLAQLLPLIRICVTHITQEEGNLRLLQIHEIQLPLVLDAATGH